MRGWKRGCSSNLADFRREDEVLQEGFEVPFGSLDGLLPPRPATAPADPSPFDLLGDAELQLSPQSFGADTVGPLTAHTGSTGELVRGAGRWKEVDGQRIEMGCGWGVGSGWGKGVVDLGLKWWLGRAAVFFIGISGCFGRLGDVSIPWSSRLLSPVHQWGKMGVDCFLADLLLENGHSGIYA